MTSTKKAGARTSSRTSGRKPSVAERRREALRRYHRRRIALGWAAGILVAALAVGGLYLTYNSRSGTTTGDPGSGKAGEFAYQVGSPGPGETAPEFTLPATTGQSVSLRDHRGKTVLLYFHEGGGCQPCWSQIRDLEQRAADLKAAGIDELLTITTDPLDLHTQKMADDGLSSTGLSDTDLAVSTTYDANKYGMMGDTRDGHSFLLVDPDGVIQWRADYGGAPEYTMYVPVDNLLADLRAGLNDTTGDRS